MRHVALIIFYTEDGRILLQDRRSISKAGEAWGYFGGGIEDGETPEAAVVRETKEELSYDLKERQFLGTVTTNDSRGTIERHVFVAPFPGFDAFEQKEGDGMRLCTLDEAKQLKTVFGDDKVVQLFEKTGLPPRVIVKDSPIHGRGVYAARISRQAK
jgi:8-oxo-dGTP pyrophosphatase MutT (NUDIX family)